MAQAIERNPKFNPKFTGVVRVEGQIDIEVYLEIESLTEKEIRELVVDALTNALSGMKNLASEEPYCKESQSLLVVNEEG